MKYLVTGGCGFIGSHLAEALVKAGHLVRILDNLSSGFEKNIKTFRQDVELIVGDVRQLHDLTPVMKGVDSVFHLAALVSVFDSVNRPLDNHAINVTGTLNVLEAARQAGVKRVVFASSAAVYGNEPTLPKVETMMPQFESPYALAKLNGEYNLSLFHKLYDLETVSLRFFNVFGPRQDPSSMYSGVISIFHDKISQHQTPVIFGDGQQTRDFVAVQDVVAANLLAMQSDRVGSGESINVATGRKTSLLELVDVLADIYGEKVAPDFQEGRVGDIQHSVADIVLAQKLLGFTPTTSLRDGLEALKNI